MRRPQRNPTLRENLESIFSCAISNDVLYRRALTHRGGTASPGTFADHDYERLEFLGDRVLALSIAEMLMKRFPDASEGELALRLVDHVRGERCAAIGKSLGIDRLLRFTGSRETENPPDSVVADVVEALLGAAMLDKGYAFAAQTVLRWWSKMIDTQSAPEKDAKSQLQEWAQGCGLPLPVYEVREQSGPDHNPEFTLSVRIADQGEAFGRAGSKRAAEQAAARSFLKRAIPPAQRDGK